ncbi:MAG: GxxExxY protein [Fimbriiglobus sp.]
MKKADYDRFTESIIGAAIDVHRELGPGLLESAYEACLEYELVNRGFKVQRQVMIPVVYRGLSIEAGFRADLLVNELILIELKAIDRLEKIHEAQMLTYLKLMNLKLGLLMNFNVKLLTEGIKRMALGTLED